MPHVANGTPAVTTMLLRDERLRVDAAGCGLFVASHRESVADVIRDIRDRSARALLVSTAYCQESSELAHVVRIVREFPQVPTVALISQLDRGTARTVLTLGQYGIRTLVDVRDPSGWRELRSLLLNEYSGEMRQRCVAEVCSDLVTAPIGARRFFEALFAIAPRTPRIRAVAQELQIIPSTLMSRFFRQRLPAPKLYLAHARLIYAARLFENPGLSVASVATKLDYSSAQSFARHVRAQLGMSSAQFREQFDAEGMLQRFRDELVLRYLATWRGFNPLAPSRRWRSPHRRAVITPRPLPAMPLARLVPTGGSHGPVSAPAPAHPSLR